MPSRAANCIVEVVALGVSLELQCEDDSIAEHVRRAWGDAAPNGHAVREAGALTVGMSSTNDVGGTGIEELLHHLSPAVTTRAIEARAGELVMLHAAALADPDSGATAVLVAPSGTGKTTAALTLGRRFAYLSDETAGIDEEGRLAPYRKPLSIIEGGPLKHQVSPSELGLVTTDDACRLAALLVIERDPGHRGVPVVAELSTIDALTLLAPQASSLGRLDKPLARLVDLVNRAGGVRHVTYAEAGTLPPVVSHLLAEDRE